MDMEHGISDDMLPPELLQRRQLLREAQTALLRGQADEAERRLARADECGARGRARLLSREREAFS
jgi:hypothetical protein